MRKWGWAKELTHKMVDSLVCACIPVTGKQSQIDPWCWPGSLVYLAGSSSMWDWVSKIGEESLRINAGGYCLATHAPFTPKHTHTYVHFFYVEKSLSNALTTERIMRGGEWVTKMGAMGQKAVERGKLDLCSPLYIVLALLATTKMVSEVPHVLCGSCCKYFLPVYFCPEYSINDF